METHQRVIIERILNYGTLRDWRWAISQYGASAVRTVLAPQSGARDNLRAEARRLAAIMRSGDAWRIKPEEYEIVVVGERPATMLDLLHQIHEEQALIADLMEQIAELQEQLEARA